METKICSDCKIQKPLLDFSVRVASRDGRCYVCKSCKKEYVKANKDKISEYSKKYFSEEKNYFRRKTYCKKYNLLNKERLAKLKSEYRKDPKKKKEIDLRITGWRHSNKEYILVYNNKRREVKKFLDSNYTEEDRFYTKCLFNNKCFKCGSRDRICIDHHMPLNIGFGLSRNNAVLLCKSCNSIKKSKLPSEFYSKEELDFLISLGIRKE